MWEAAATRGARERGEYISGNREIKESCGLGKITYIGGLDIVNSGERRVTTVEVVTYRASYNRIVFLN